MGLFIVNIHGDIEGDYEIIKQIPSADVRENVRGKWIKTKCKGDDMYSCKKCGWMKWLTDDRDYNFCPNCGADMRKE